MINCLFNELEIHVSYIINAFSTLILRIDGFKIAIDSDEMEPSVVEIILV